MTSLKFTVGIMPTDPPKKFIELVKSIDNCGYDTAWIFDGQLHRDVYATLAVAALNTSRLRLGAGVTNPITRHPAISAAAVATVDELSGGRAIFGMARGHAIIRPLGLHHASAEACREAIQVARRLFRGETVDHEGKTIRLRGAGLKFKCREDIPIYMAASGPEMLELAGEIADGVIIQVGVYPKALQYALERIRTGAERAGRSLEKIDTLCWAFCTLSEDRTLARQTVRTISAWAPGNLSANYVSELTDINISDLKILKEAYKQVTFYAAADQIGKFVTDEMVEKFSLSGTSEDMIKRIKEIQRQVGMRHFGIYPVPPPHEDRESMTRRFTEEVMSKF